MKMLSITLAFVTIGSSLLAQGASVAVCEAKDFVNGVEGQVIATVGRTYSPKCLRIQKGTTVTISASGNHPLQAADPVNGVDNPFLNPAGGSTSPQTHTLTNSGEYGFFCTHHGNAQGQGMVGVIRVE